MSRSRVAVSTALGTSFAAREPQLRRHFGPEQPLDLSGRLNSLVAADSPAKGAYRLRSSAGPRNSGMDDPFRLRGQPKFCPVCDSEFGHFRPFGLDRRKNALCPGCGSLERHRFLWLYLDRTLRLSSRRQTLLHIAPEGCIRRRLGALPRGRYIPADLYRPDVPYRMDVTRLTLPDGSIDMVVCNHVLEHVLDDRAALAEFARVLRPGGRAIIMVPLDLSKTTVEDEAAATAGQRLAAFGHPYHVRICGSDYGDRMEKAGFDVRRVDSAAMPAHRRRYHRVNKTSLFDCRLR